jgi:hypothetical protein
VGYYRPIDGFRFTGLLMTECINLRKSDPLFPITTIVVAPPAADALAPIPIPVDRVDICGPNECMTAGDAGDEVGITSFSLQDIGNRVYSPGSSLVSLLVSKGSHAVTPVLPNGVQWVQAGRRYAAYKGNVHLGGIDPVATGDPAHPFWVAYAKGSRNEITHPSIREAMEWVMENATKPGRLITDILQEQVGPINLRLDKDGYRVAIRLKGTDNQLCIYMFDNINATSQELRFNLGIIPAEPSNAIAWLDTMVKGLKAGLQLYRDWAEVPGILLDDDEDEAARRLLFKTGVMPSYDELRQKSGLSSLAYSPPEPAQVVELDPLASQAMPEMPDLDKAAQAEMEAIAAEAAQAMDGITFVPRSQDDDEKEEWKEYDERDEWSDGDEE